MNSKNFNKNENLEGGGKWAAYKAATKHYSNPVNMAKNFGKTGTNIFSSENRSLGKNKGLIDNLSNQDLISSGDTRSNLKKDLKDKGIFAAVVNTKMPYFEAIYDQPCFKLPSEIKDGLSETGYTKAPVPFQFIKSAFNKLFETDEYSSVFTKTVKGLLMEFIAFFIFNPFFFWYSKESEEDGKEKYSWGHSRGAGDYLLKNFVTKFIFCVFKLVGSPFVILYYASVLFYVFILSLKIDHIAYSLFAALRVIPLPVTQAFPFLVPNKELYIKDENTEAIVLDENPQNKIYNVWDTLVYLLGTVIPFHLILGEAKGETYGKGGISALIIIFMLISVFIIVLGGFNILVVIAVFLIYFYKVLYGLADESTKK